MGFAIRKLDAATGPGPDEAIKVHSRLAGPIDSLGFLRRSLLFAELSELSYLSRASAGRLAHQIGFPEIRFYDKDGAQAYLLANDDDAVIVCRGTEPDDWNDVRADLTLELVCRPLAGRRDGRDLCRPLRPVAHPVEPAGAVHVRQPANRHPAVRELRRARGLSLGE